MHCKNSVLNPAGIYLHKINNRNSRTRCEICSKLKLKTPFLLLTLNMLPTGKMVVRLYQFRWNWNWSKITQKHFYWSLYLVNLDRRKIVEARCRAFMRAIVACMRVPFPKIVKKISQSFAYFHAFVSFFCILSPFLKKLHPCFHALEYAPIFKKYIALYLYLLRILFLQK